MANLTDDIATYYKQNFNALPDDKKFHFATRLSAWRSDEFAQAYLSQVQSLYVRDEAIMGRDLKNLLTDPPAAKINAAAARAPYFEKYPDLRGLMLSLFRVRHLESVYNFDARTLLTDLYPLEKMRALSDALKADREALKTLSTYAINLIYLVDDILFPVPGRSVPVDMLYDIGRSYDTTSHEQIQLMIYFYTHCIIGASNFYTRELPESHLETYRQMVKDLDFLVEDNYESVNLDNKFELLVCARMTRVNMNIEKPVAQEASRSLSAHGTFIVDTENSHRQTDKTSFGDSEHRNVLFILSGTAYSPNESI